MTARKNNYKLTRYACYFLGFSMAASVNLSAILFVPFRDLYDVSYTKLGFLVLINFCTQLGVDLIFSFFSDKFNLTKTIKSMPLIVFAGLMVYSVLPFVFPEYTYIFLVTGTLIFSIGAGLGEVLTSPVIAAIPSENPEGEISKLHSAYAWGTVVVVIVSTVFLKLFGTDNWFYLAFLWSIIPLVSLFLFVKAEIPSLNLHGEDNAQKSNDRFGIMLLTACIFFGGAAECTMTQWISGFAEKALGIPKIYGDVFGMALFAFALGVGRTLHSKKGKGIYNVLLSGMGLSCLCYIIAALSGNSVIGLSVCVLTGFFSSMLWPGTIIYTNEKYVSCGVGVYALLAAGGDLGASLAPQLLGVVTDKISTSAKAVDFSISNGINPEQLAMKTGMLFAAAFPFVGFFLLIYIKRYFSKTR